MAAAQRGFHSGWLSVHQHDHPCRAPNWLMGAQWALAAAGPQHGGPDRLPGLPRLRVCHPDQRYPPCQDRCSARTNGPVGQDGWSLASWLPATIVDRDLNRPRAARCAARAASVRTLANGAAEQHHGPKSAVALIEAPKLGTAVMGFIRKAASIFRLWGFVDLGPSPRILVFTVCRLPVRMVSQSGGSEGQRSSRRRKWPGRCRDGCTPRRTVVLTWRFARCRRHAGGRFPDAAREPAGLYPVAHPVRVAGLRGHGRVS